MKNLLKECKKNPTYELYAQIIEDNFDDYHKCIKCDNHIYYTGNSFRFTNDYNIIIIWEMDFNNKKLILINS